MKAGKRSEFIARLKFANAYYHKWSFSTKILVKIIICFTTNSISHHSKTQNPHQCFPNRLPYAIYPQKVPSTPLSTKIHQKSSEICCLQCDYHRKKYFFFLLEHLKVEGTVDQHKVYMNKYLLESVLNERWNDWLKKRTTKLKTWIGIDLDKNRLVCSIDHEI